MNFSEIIGQETIKQQLLSAVNNKTPSQAYIIEGEKGSGKKMLADAFAAAMLCEGEGEKPCGECHSCKMAKGANHPDIIHITHEKPNLIKAEEIRLQLIDDVVLRPFYGKYKIYIVDEAEKMNMVGQNAILKTLEDPPEYAIVMLLTTQSSIFLPTILSRCMKLSIEPVRDELVVEHLIEKEQIPKDDATLVAAFARGNLGKAIELSNSSEFIDIKTRTISLLSNIRRKSSDVLLKETNSLIKDSEDDLAGLFDFFVIWYRDVLIYKSTGSRDMLIYREDAYAISQEAAKLSYSSIRRNIETINHARNQIRTNMSKEHVFGELILSLK